MRKLHDKSIILGIGIGMIITAIAGMIFSGGNQKELSKAEIIKLAKGYGLIKQVEFLNDDNDLIDSTNVTTSTSTNKTVTGDTSADKSAAGDTSVDKSAADDSSADKNAASDSSVDKNATSDSPADKSTTGDSSEVESTIEESNTTNSTGERNISIKVRAGNRAQDLINTLLKKKVISSEKDFKTVLNSYKASRKIKIGTFMFKKNEDLNYIVKTICDLK